MVSLDNMLAFAVASAILVIIPGPSLMFIIGRALQMGRRGAMLTVLGNALGLAVVIVLVGVGLGALLAASAIAFTALKLAGAAYLVWLGVQAIRHRGDGDGVPGEAGAAGSERSAAAVMWEAAVVGFTNPKAIVFMAALLPQFVDPAAGAALPQMLILGSVFLVVALASDSLIALAAGGARDWFARSPSRLRRLRAGGGVMMIGLGAALALSRR